MSAGLILSGPGALPTFIAELKAFWKVRSLINVEIETFYQFILPNYESRINAVRSGMYVI